MRFVIIEPDRFRKYLESSPYKSFMQTPEIADLRYKAGWTPYYFGVEDEDELIAAAMMVAKPSFLGKSTFQCPGGPLLNYDDTKLLTFFISHLKSFAKSHNGYVLHIDPYYEYQRYDRNGEPLARPHHKAKANLQKLNFREISHASQPKYLFIMELANRTPQQILADFKRNTRNHIKKADKKGVRVRELKREELPILKQITESTSHRRGFIDRPLSYYEKMYDLFHAKGEVMFLLAEAPSEDNIPLSAAMFMLYGDEVVYLFSGSDEKYMKEFNAQYAIQWHMIKYASEHGFKTYNFYGIHGLPDKSDPDYGIYDFKKGFGADYGRIIELLGTYELPISRLFYHLHHFLSKFKPHNH